MSDASARSVTFDHTSREQVQDPYPLYAELRTTCPVAHSAAHGGFHVATSYETVKRVFSDFRTFSSSRGVGIPPQPFLMNPIDTDPPVQTRTRKLLNPLFTPERFATLAPRIQQVADELIDAFIERGEAELGEALIRPLLATIVLPVIGVPTQDRLKVGRWIDTLARQRGTRDDLVAEAASATIAYLTELSASRRADPSGDDVLGTVLRSDIGPEGTTPEDDLAWRILIIVLLGGLDTTSAVMMEALRYLSQRPDEAQKLLAGDYDWATAIEELVRYTSPVQTLARSVTHDAELGGVCLRKDGWIMGVLGSANRDADHFADPDTIRLDRTDNEHLGFGAGAHICLGRNLARVEIRILLETVLRRMADFRLADDFAPEFSLGEARGIKAFPVVFTPGQRVGTASRTAA